jgi:hypothetical protein
VKRSGLRSRWAASHRAHAQPLLQEAILRGAELVAMGREEAGYGCSLTECREAETAQTHLDLVRQDVSQETSSQKDVPARALGRARPSPRETTGPSAETPRLTRTVVEQRRKGELVARAILPDEARGWVLRKQKARRTSKRLFQASCIDRRSSFTGWPRGNAGLSGESTGRIAASQDADALGAAASRLEPVIRA